MKTNSIFKKTVLFAMMGLTLVNFTPRKSEALVGLATGVVPMMIIGGGATVLGFALSSGALDPADELTKIDFFLAGIVGLIVLDDHHQVSPHFAALNAENARGFDIDPGAEMNAYNQSLPAINAINQTIVTETLAFNQANTTRAELSDFITAKWANYGALLDPNALSALKKVQASLATSMNTTPSKHN
jgi:hypothetical protein